LWLRPPEHLELGSAAGVDVWRAELDLAPRRVEELATTLAPDEAARAARLYFPQDRARFIAARGLLRRILARYVHWPPEALRFTYGARGKPSLAEPGAGLEFNLAHSHGLALYAVTRGRPVGVDIEYIRPQLAAERIAERFFSAEEVAALRALAPEEQAAAFFRCWTRKEALLKAWGQGLAFGLDRFTVSCAVEQAAVLATAFDPAEAARWSLYPLDPGPGYVGALAARGPVSEVRCWQFDFGPPEASGLQWSEK
jgi:4'-phosphopantetheinyl transferase